MAKAARIETVAMARCPGCCICEGGVDNMKRSAVLWTIGICTVGFGLLILPFFKKCTTCGHNHFMNNHTAKEVK